MNEKNAVLERLSRRDAQRLDKLHKAHKAREEVDACNENEEYFSGAFKIKSEYIEDLLAQGSDDIPPECLDQDQDIEICEEDCVETTDFRLYMRQNYNWVLEGYYILGEKIADHKTRELDHKVWSSEGKI
ncbi:hypothetical protein MSG28_006504 [Choristoneura fumiferana]|uniref:Uncharacterized protein n=1 Tax=Choristoneura fumiferana TaxID=7141 RepID=A0ACC0JF63_CHOFU|nr:hypothetical protein MSG28_006504 [Choristoneura fumiferana]